MIVYTYDEITKIYNGSVQIDDDAALPGNAVPVMPPVLEGPFVAVCNAEGDGWDTVEDYRYSMVVDTVTGGRMSITGLGPLPEGLRYIPPEVAAFDEARAAKLAELMAAYDAAFAPIDAVYPAKERETWPVQLEEAAAVLADESAETPMLSIMVATRGQGETPADLARIVMENNALYRQLAGALTGQQQRMYAEITALESVDALQAYEVAFTMPQGLNYPGA